MGERRWPPTNISQRIHVSDGGRSRNSKKTAATNSDRTGTKTDMRTLRIIWPPEMSGAGRRSVFFQSLIRMAVPAFSVITRGNKRSSLLVLDRAVDGE